MPKSTRATTPKNRYKALIEKIFFEKYAGGNDDLVFERDEIEKAARTLKISLPKNVGDVMYSMRFRTQLPERIIATQPKDREWVIEGVGRSRYAFRLVKVGRIQPNPHLITIKIPEAVPEIVARYSLSDEQALLAKVRYNRLIDIFLGISAYSMQSHLRTAVRGIGQIEIDEVYVGVDRAGCHYIVPVQAKAGCDKLGSVQTKQDIAYCAERFPELVCRAISVQFVDKSVIALLELTLIEGEVRIVGESHYCLVPAESISCTELAEYRNRKVPH